MTIAEFVKSIYFDLEGEKEVLSSDPYLVALNNDDLPYDEILRVEGKVQKVVYTEDGRIVTIIDLLSNDKLDDIDVKDKYLRELYEAYMSNICVEEPKIKRLISLLRKSGKDV